LNKAVTKFLILTGLSLFVGTCTSVHKDQESRPQAEDQKVEKALSEEERLEAAISRALEKGNSEDIEYLAGDIFIKASDSSVRGDSELASYLYQNLLRLKPNDAYLMRKYAVELIRLGKLEPAKGLMQKVVSLQSYSDESSALLLGGVLTALDDVSGSKYVYQQTLKAHPLSEESCIFLAKIEASEKNYTKAHSLLKKCDSKNKTKGIFSYYRGKVYLQQGKNKSARTFFKRASSKEEGFYQGTLALGLMKEEKNKKKQAVLIYKKFLKKNPQSYPILSRLVQLMFSIEDYSGIIGYAEQLSALDQSDLNLKVKLGILYSDQKRFDDAIGTFKEILTVVPNSDKVLYYLGSLYQEIDRSQLAIEAFSKIDDQSSLYMDSSMQIAQILRALVLANRSQWSGRYVAFLEERKDKAAELKLELSLLLADHFEETRDYGRAIASLESVRQEKGYGEGHDYYLASLFEKIKRNDKARSIIENILINDPDNAHALNFIGYSLLEEGKDLGKALSYIKKALSLNPKDGYIRDSLAWYFYKTGQFKEALAEIQKAWSYVKDDMIINKHMAMIYVSLQDYQMAKKFYSKALLYCKVATERKKIQKALDVLVEDRLPASH
jgi:tetratricopeptide (TPR) repeat protein